MPITSSAKKAMRQTKARTQRRKPYKSRLKSELKKFAILAKTDKEKAGKMLPSAYSVIDIACKKNIIHKNNADRKKSGLARMLTREIAPVAVKTAKASGKKVSAKGKKTSSKAKK